MAGWVFAIVSPENLVRILLCAIPAYRHSLVPRRAVTTQPELSGFAEAMRWANHFIPRGARLRILFYSKHATSVTIGTAHARRHISSAHTCNKLSVRLKCNFHVPAHHAHGHAGNTGNECADAAASLGMKGFVSENNVPVFRPECDIFVQRLFEVLHCLTQIAEVLHSMVVQSQPGYFLSYSAYYLVCLSDALLIHLLRSISFCASIVLDLFLTVAVSQKHFLQYPSCDG